MKSPIRLPLRSLNRKKKKEDSKLQEQMKLKDCHSSLTQSTSYSSCINSLASSTQTRISREPPGWVNNPPPSGFHYQTNRHKENYVPQNIKNIIQNPSSTIPRRHLPVLRQPRDPLKYQMHNMSPYQRQRLVLDEQIQINYSESSCNDGSSISSIGEDMLEQAMDIMPGSGDAGDRFDLNSYQFVLNVDNDNVSTSASMTEVQQEASSHQVTPTVLNVERMQDIYSSMMLKFREKIVTELKEEMQKGMEDEISVLKNELKQMSSRVMYLEKKQTSANSLQQNFYQAPSSDNDGGGDFYQQKKIEDMIDTKIATAMAKANMELNLALHDVKREGKRLTEMAVRAETAVQYVESKQETSFNHTTARITKKELDSKNALFSESFTEAKKSLDAFLDECDSIANGIDTIASRIQGGEESDNDYF